MSATAQLTRPVTRFRVLDDDLPGSVYIAGYTAGDWYGLCRWRGYRLRHRRSRTPFLEGGDGQRVPVEILH